MNWLVHLSLSRLTTSRTADCLFSCDFCVHKQLIFFFLQRTYVPVWCARARQHENKRQRRFFVVTLGSLPHNSSFSLSLSLATKTNRAAVTVCCFLFGYLKTLVRCMCVISVAKNEFHLKSSNYDIFRVLSFVLICANDAFSGSWLNLARANFDDHIGVRTKSEGFSTEIPVDISAVVFTKNSQNELVGVIYWVIVVGNENN
jgi:hypothetical protein